MESRSVWSCNYNVVIEYDINSTEPPFCVQEGFYSISTQQLTLGCVAQIHLRLRASLVPLLSFPQPLVQGQQLSPSHQWRSSISDRRSQEGTRNEVDLLTASLFLWPSCNVLASKATKIRRLGGIIQTVEKQYRAASILTRNTDKLCLEAR